MFDSMTGCASATGIPLSVLRAVKKAGCMFTSYGRCDLALFLRFWFAKNLSADDQINWSQRLKKADAKIREIELQLKEESVVSIQYVRELARDVIGNTYDAELDRLAHEMPAALKGKSETEIHAELRRQNVAIRDKMQSVIEKWKLDKASEAEAAAKQNTEDHEAK